MSSIPQLYTMYSSNFGSDVDKNNRVKTVMSEKYGSIEMSAPTREQLWFKCHTHAYNNFSFYTKWWDAHMSEILGVKIFKSSDWEVSITSLIGTSCDFPISYGNYFYVNVNDKGFHNISIMNIWLENLEEAIKEFNIKELEFEVFNDGSAIITSPLIPDNWYIQELYIRDLSSVDAYKVRYMKGLTDEVYRGITDTCKWEMNSDGESVVSCEDDTWIYDPTYTYSYCGFCGKEIERI